MPKHNTTKVKKTYVLRLTIDVEAEQDYITWLDKKLGRPIDITDLLTELDESPLIPDYCDYKDTDRWCDHPDNYAFSSYCNKWSMKATIGD